MKKTASIFIFSKKFGEIPNSPLFFYSSNIIADLRKNKAMCGEAVFGGKVSSSQPYILVASRTELSTSTIIAAQ